MTDEPQRLADARRLAESNAALARQLGFEGFDLQAEVQRYLAQPDELWRTEPTEAEEAPRIRTLRKF